MALLQISEPGQTAAPHQRKLAVGIDLGTTNSLVATVRSGKSETLPDEDGSHLLPSVVRYQQDVLLQVGARQRGLILPSAPATGRIVNQDALETVQRSHTA